MKVALSGLGIPTAAGEWPAISGSRSRAGHSAATHHQCERNEWLALAADPMVRLQMAGLSAECTHFHAHTHLHLHQGQQQAQQQKEAAVAAAGLSLPGKVLRIIGVSIFPAKHAFPFETHFFNNFPNH